MKVKVLVRTLSNLGPMEWVADGHTAGRLREVGASKEEVAAVLANSPKVQGAVSKISNDEMYYYLEEAAGQPLPGNYKPKSKKPSKARLAEITAIFDKLKKASDAVVIEFVAKKEQNLKSTSVWRLPKKK